MKCKNDYKAYSGIDNGRDDYQTAAEAVLWQSCDVARLLIVGLQQAGHDLTADAVVHGLETIKNQPMAYFGNVTFAPGKHSGVDQQRTLTWLSYQDAAGHVVYGGRRLGPRPRSVPFGG